MSELQLGLLIISAVIVVAVLAYNKIEQIRLTRRTETAFGSKHEDVLLGTPPPAEPVEHVLGAADGFAEPQESAVSAPPPSAAGPALRAAALDERVDFIVAIELPKAYRGGDLAALAQTHIEPALRKPVHWEGYDADMQGWQPVQPQHAYTQLRAGLQLGNRDGPAGEDDIAAFLSGIAEIGAALNARIDTSDADEAMDAALALDAFCADHDIQIGLSVLARDGQTLAGTKIRALAESHGCALAKDGRYYKLGDHGEVLYALGNAEPMPFHAETLKVLSTRGVALTLDVPRAPGVPATFRAFIEFARQLTQAMDGVLVDDERKAIGDAAIDQIAQQLNAIHQAMASRGIPAGGALALRLFV